MKDKKGEISPEIFDKVIDLRSDTECLENQRF